MDEDNVVEKYSFLFF